MNIVLLREIADKAITISTMKTGLWRLKKLPPVHRWGGSVHEAFRRRLDRCKR
jgi:hypothetical protein